MMKRMFGRPAPEGGGAGAERRTTIKASIDAMLPAARGGGRRDLYLRALFDGLWVADVTDGMDAVGLQNVGLMDPSVR